MPESGQMTEPLLSQPPKFHERGVCHAVTLCGAGSGKPKVESKRPCAVNVHASELDAHSLHPFLHPPYPLTILYWLSYPTTTTIHESQQGRPR